MHDIFHLRMNFVVLLGSNYNTDNGIEGVEQHLPRLLTRYGNVYCFEYPQFTKTFKILGKSLPLIEKFNSNLYVVHTFGLMPFGHQFSSINRINHALNAKIFQKDIENISAPITTISFTPEVIYLPQIIKKSRKIFYYVTDNYYAMPYWSGRGNNQLRQLETKLFLKTNGIITVSEPLYDKYRYYHNNVKLFTTPSAGLDLFKRSTKTPDVIKHLPRPILGFSGSFYEWKIDMNLILTLLKLYPRYTFVFTGSLSLQDKEFILKLNKFPNFRFLGFISDEKLPSVIKNFDVCIIPYIMNSWGHFAYPVKVNQYLAAGKPVVTTALKSIKYLYDKNLIYWSKNHQEFTRNLRQAIKTGMRDKKLIKARISEGLRNDWLVRLNELMKFINYK